MLKRLLWTLTVITHYGHTLDSPVFVSHVVSPGGPCTDLDPKCSIWASQGECQTNAAWMMGNCRRSCQSCQGGENAWRLRTQLAAAYDQTPAALKNFSIGRVSFESFRLDHADVKEGGQTVQISGQLVLTWNDTKVQWNKDDWSLSWLNFYWIPFWTPHLLLSNALPGSAGTVSWRELAANYTGQIYMWLDYTFEVACPFDYTNFPADSQKCCYKIDERRYYTVRLLVKESAKIELQDSLAKATSPGWKVTGAELRENKYNVHVLTDWHKNAFNVENTNAQLCITVQRLSSYKLSELSGPAIASAVVTLSSFLVGGFSFQIAMLLGSLLLQLLSLYPLVSRLPPAFDGTPNIVKFYSFNMGLTLLILILVILLDNLRRLRKGLPPPRVLDKCVAFAEKFLPHLRSTDEVELKSAFEKTEDGLQTVPSSTSEFYWAPLAKVLNGLLFICFLAIYIFVMIGCLAV